MSQQTGEPIIEAAPAGVVVPKEQDPPAPPKLITEAELEAERKRRQEIEGQLSESDKQFQAMKDEVAALRKRQEEDDAARAAEAKRLADEEAARKRLEEENLSTKELLDRRMAEIEQARQEEKQAYESRFNEMQSQIAQRDALLAKEREFQQLMEYRQTVLQTVGDQIHPALHDLVAGSTTEEIDQSAQAMVERSARILEEAAEAMSYQRQTARGVSTAGAPPIGPMDLEPGTEVLTNEQLAAMPMSEYIKRRPGLLGAASAARNRGLFD